MLILPALPQLPYLSSQCQHFNVIGTHTLLERFRGRVGEGLGIKSGLLRKLKPAPQRRELLGEPSRFAEGDWVRVRDEASIRSTLDARACLRGLSFGPAQWTTCSKLYRVYKVMRRIIDDQGRMRPVSRTVLLCGVDCTGDDSQKGCGRHCPMMYRDEWLEPVSVPLQAPPPKHAPSRLARVRPLDEILRGLDLLHQRNGVVFMPEMARYAGLTAPILGQLPQVFEYGRWVEPRSPVYILGGLHCTGAVFGCVGPCDRACHLLWHADWLVLASTNGLDHVDGETRERSSNGPSLRGDP
ncbi:MAG TPA: hypothetical protein VIV60_13325 [Polyangiaceae bacterium]